VRRIDQDTVHIKDRTPKRHYRDSLVDGDSHAYLVSPRSCGRLRAPWRQARALPR
jgi:hypothetical protein